MKDFLFTLLAWLLTLPFIVATVAFAIYNAQTIPVTINPFQPPTTLPVYVPVLAAIAFGFLFGSVMTWAGMGWLRKECRRQKQQIKELEKKLLTQNGQAQTTHNYALIPSAFLERR